MLAQAQGRYHDPAALCFPPFHFMSQIILPVRGSICVHITARLRTEVVRLACISSQARACALTIIARLRTEVL